MRAATVEIVVLLGLRPVFTVLSWILAATCKVLACHQYDRCTNGYFRPSSEMACRILRVAKSHSDTDTNWDAVGAIAEVAGVLGILISLFTSDWSSRCIMLDWLTTSHLR